MPQRGNFPDVFCLICACFHPPKSSACSCLPLHPGKGPSPSPGGLCLSFSNHRGAVPPGSTPYSEVMNICWNMGKERAQEHQEWSTAQASVWHRSDAGGEPALILDLGMPVPGMAQD